MMMKNYKILVVDDQKDNLITIVGMIEEKKQAWNIYQANNGELAINIAEKIIPDLIIMDWEMPQMSGIEATRKLKQNELTKDIPIIICTGIMTSSEHLETAFEAGAVDFIRKPIDMIELHSRIQSMLMLSESYNQIKSLDNAKNKLLSIIAHDLKNPIYTIKLLLDFILQKDLDQDKRQEILKGVSSSAGSAFSLLENLLAWTNSQRNQIKFLPETFKLMDVVEDIYKLLSLNAESKSIILESAVDPNLSVYADKNMISTILRNLVANAIKFNKKDTHIKIVAVLENENVIISVIDNGVGISKENLERIMNNEETYTSVSFNNEIGSGLGLQVCKEFLKKHNSKLEIKSAENNGSEFKFRLPNY